MKHRTGDFGEGMVQEAKARQREQAMVRHEGHELSRAGGGAVELFEVVSQAAGTKVVGKQLVDGAVPSEAEDIDLLAPFAAWKVTAGDTVAAYSLADGTWRLLSEPPVGAGEYQVAMADADGLLIFDYPRAH